MDKTILSLVGIKKDYKLGNNDLVHALKGVSINFRENEFVAILGPSGCGKTTLLNIIGGLDKYTDGDLIISGVSTKTYKDRQWDVYRNHRIGFIFQSYNLIPHQTVLENVELALTIAGLSKKERQEKAREVIDRVGLKGLYNKRPNQLSGGQCQRVAIARALVNEPEILLADEPTGALDTTTSTQIMDLIKEISSEKLVIMVTHNPDIANKYSTRIVNLLDGEIISDSNPLDSLSTIDNKQNDNWKAKMKFRTAFRLSLRNLLSKLRRTILVCIAGSIGIVGVSTVLAVSAGVHNYIDSIQDDMLSGNPITITENSIDLQSMLGESSTRQKLEILQENGYVKVNSIVESLIKRSQTMNSYAISNDITKEYVDYVKAMPKENYKAIKFDYGFDVSNNIYAGWKLNSTYDEDVMSISSIINMYTSVLEMTDFKDYASYITQVTDNIMMAPNNKDYIESQYDMLKGKVATKKDEVMLVVNKNRQLTDILLAELGYYSQDEFIQIIYKNTDNENYDENLDKEKFSYDELLNKELIYYPNDSIFTKNEGEYAEIRPFNYKAYKDDTFNNGLNLKIVGILQPKDDISYGCLQSGLYYTEELSEYMKDINYESEITTYYKDKDISTITSGEYEMSGYKVQTGVTYKYKYYFNEVEYDNVTGYLGKVSAFDSIYGMISSMISGLSGISTGKDSNSKIYQITLRQLGGENIANSIYIYPNNFEDKYLVTSYLDKWNEEAEVDENKSIVKYNDNLEIIISLINNMIDMITYALIAFTALSLLVSTVMIGIITYVSVVERVKEIGVIRSLGGRKRDVSHLFNAETFIIGLVSGILGILITMLFALIINIIIGYVADINTIAIVRVNDAAIMIGVSIILTLISGLIPAQSAAKKDPVVALRTE